MNQQKMSTSIERVFRKLPQQGFFKEIRLHFINYHNPDGSIQRSKLDKEIPGGIYKIAMNPNENSQYGEVMYTFPGTTEPVRLLCIGRTEGDFRYGRF